MAGRLYDNAMYRFDSPEPSYWEATAGDPGPSAPVLQADEQCDVAVIGGGYTGISTAYHLCRDHQVDVRVLEAGHIGWGASGRNGGFCSIGGDGLGAEAMIKSHGLQNAKDYYRAQVEAVGLVRHLIREEGIDAVLQGDAELAIACSKKGFERLKAHAEVQFRLLGLDASVVTRNEFAQRYFESPLQHGGAVLRPTFGLHPMRYILGLAIAAERKGVILHAHSEVIDWNKDGQHHVLRTNGGCVRAKQVVLATNGYSPEHLHRQIQGRTLPMISSIVVTRPMNDEELGRQKWQTESPAITSKNLLNYFRLLPDRRFLFGGRGSADGSTESASRNYKKLIARMHEVFPGWRDIAIDYRWHGLVCMTRRLTPAIGRFDDDSSVFFGFGYHGNGVNTAAWAGKQIARWVGGSKEKDVPVPAWLPKVVHGMPGRLPIPSLRLHYIRAAIGAKRMTDRLN